MTPKCATLHQNKEISALDANPAKNPPTPQKPTDRL